MKRRLLIPVGVLLAVLAGVLFLNCGNGPSDETVESSIAGSKF